MQNATSTPRQCSTCRHHSKGEKRRALGVADEDLELVTFADETDEGGATETWACCMVQGNKEIGILASNPPPGVGCSLWEEGSRGRLSPELERLMARSAERARG